jgi:hypothetical protein
MKKILLSIVAMLFAVSVSAQTEKLLNWGIEGGMNFNSMSFKSSDLESGNRAGFFIGPKVKVNVPLLGFGVDAAVLYSMNSANVKKGGAALTKKLSYLEVPLNLRYSFGLKVLSMYLATGPQYNYCMSETTSRSTWGWNLGGGVEIASHLQIGVSYTFPVSNTSEFAFPGFDDFLAKQKTAKIRLAYFF